ncbi:MAG: hypothetical protein H7210_14435 [Pyrinomonadaceae bacterium]|nr:hypothetical protein [Phycisphaerales bacterium]
MISSRAILATVALVLLLSVAPTFGQASIPNETITSSDLTTAQKDVVKRLVDAHKEGLAGTFSEVKKARNALLEPLQNQAVSVSFRLNYAQLLVPVLRPLIASEKEIVAINALRITGELATTTSLDLLSDGLNDKRPGVRFAAVAGYEATFTALERTSPAIAQPSQATASITNLKNKLSKEEDASVLDAFALALQAASKVPSRKLDGVRGAAITTLSEAMSAKAQTATDGKYDAAFRRSANAARNALTATDEPTLPRAALIAATGLGGDLLAGVSRRIKSGELAVGVVGDLEEAALKKKRAEIALLVADSERTIQWASTGLGAPGANDFKLSELLLQGKDDAFQTEVLRLIGANGSLTTTNYGFGDQRFIKGGG